MNDVAVCEEWKLYKSYTRKISLKKNQLEIVSEETMKRYKLVVEGSSVMVYDLDVHGSLPSKFFKVNNIDMLTSYLGAEPGITTTFIIHASDGADVYEWEWEVVDVDHECLVNVTSKFRYCIIPNGRDHTCIEKSLMSSDYWRPGDRIRPHKKTLVQSLREIGFEYADGITRHGKPVTVSDMQDAYRIAVEFSGKELTATEFFNELMKL